MDYFDTKAFDVFASSVYNDEQLDSSRVKHWLNVCHFENVTLNVYLGPCAKHRLLHTMKEDRRWKHENNKKFAVVGCVAWLTSFEILDELSHCDAVSIVVQKEKTWQLNKPWNKALRTKYDALKSADRQILYNSDCATVPMRDPQRGDSGAVRCAGSINTKDPSTFSRMHHKFIVFGKWKPEANGFIPESVIVGSMNWSNGKSADSTLWIHDRSVASCFFNEFLAIRSFSEPLDWKSDKSNPEIDGPLVDVRIARQARSFHVAVRTLTGRTQKISVTALTTVGNLQMMAAERFGFPWEICRLIFKGKHPNLYETMESLGIGDGDTIDLLMSLSNK